MPKVSGSIPESLTIFLSGPTWNPLQALLRRSEEMGQDHMADSSGKATEIIQDAVVVAYLKSLTNSDGSYTFRFLHPIKFKGRMCGLFEHHDNLRRAAKKFDQRIKDVKREFRHYERHVNAVSSELP